jgi:DNA-binding HxlR family transcriptional regulator
MKTKTKSVPKLQPCDSHEVAKMLGDKWTMLVLALLVTEQENRLRFSEIKNGVEGISQRMLTATLRNLERDGLVTRHVFPEVPPRVEYQLTATGASLVSSMQDIMSWTQENWPDIQKSRKDYALKGSAT